MLNEVSKTVTTIFSSPIYTFQFKDHEVLKGRTLQYLENEEEYKETKAPYIDLTSADLHQNEIFQPYHEFFDDCLSFAMHDMGYSQSQAITSMWATRQKPGGFHHPHKHGNAFLAGVYYLHGDQKTHGTTFLNTDRLTMISPNRDLNRFQRISPIHRNPFVEGNFCVFPANLLHTVDPNISSETRFSLGVNSMPVGYSDDESYDRFYYPNMNEYS